jgi:penicillin-binding protein 2
VCASGVKCVWRNSYCSASNGPCVYGSIDMYWSLAVSSDVYYYQLGEQFYLTPGTDHMLLQDQVSQFGFGRDTGIDLPYEFDGRLPYAEVKQALIESGALRQTEEPRVLVGDVINLSIGQGLLAASPLQLTTAYGAFANGGYVMVPRVVSGIFPANTPAAAEPGYVDTAGLTPLNPFVPTGTQIPMPEGTDQIIGGLRQNIEGGIHNGRSTTAGELFDTGYPDSAIVIAGKTGTAQGRFSYPWNDSSVFAGFSLDSSQPYTVVAYLEKSGFGSQGAAPIVKCVFLGLSGLIAFDAPSVSEPLDPTSDQVAVALPRVDETCMMSTTANTVHPGSGPTGRPVD